MTRIDTERDQAIVSSYRSDRTLEEVGKEFGISRERVRQILVRNGVTVRTGRGVNARRRLAALDAGEVLAYYRSVGGMRQTCHHFGVSAEIIQRLIGDQITPLDRRRSFHQRRRPNEELIVELMSAARWCGVDVLTIAEYKRYRRAHPDVASEQTIMGRFGTWRKALAQIGMDGYSYPDWLGVRFSDVDIYGALLRMRDELGEVPTVEQYAALVATDEPTGHTIRKRFGSWVTACEAALKYESEGR